MSIFTFAILLSCNQPINDISSKPQDSLSAYSLSDSQKEANKILKDIFLSADTILLVGHLGIQYNPPGQNNPSPTAPPILINGKRNTSIVKKQKIITKSEIDSLVTILLRPISEDEGVSNCIFDPHHTIFILKDGAVSYIDMCFTCQQLETSQDLTSLPFFDNNKWTELERFFEKHNTRYHQYKGQ